YVRGGRAQRHVGRRVAAGPAGNVAARRPPLARAPPLARVAARGAGGGVAGPPAQLPGAQQMLGVGLPARAEVVGVRARQGALVRRAEQVRAKDLGALVIEDRGLDRSLEEVLRVAAEELVE